MDLLLNFVALTIFSLMLTIGINQSFEELTSLWRDRTTVLRALLAAVILVPAVFYVVLLVLKLPTEVASALALLAAAPGAPLITKRSQMVKADPVFTSSLQLVLAVLAIVVTPVLLAIFYASFELSVERARAFQVARQIAVVTLVPVVLGLLLSHFLPDLVKRIRKPLNLFANGLFIVLVLALVVLLVAVPDLRAKLLLGWASVFAILIVAAAAVLIGHLLGGPRKDHRAGLAIGCLARNVGLALFIAGLSNDQASVIAPILAYILLGGLVQVGYSLWLKRQPV
jgi:BASS family bile acid:Na+ symporter